MKLSLSITSIVVILISVLFVFSSCNSKNELTIEEIDSIFGDELTRPIDVEELMSKLGITDSEKFLKRILQLKSPQNLHNRQQQKL